ncbi:MAG: hypothetical protein K2F88_03840 [Duncaniella sp.]|uniref:hypothetical protein n=1 Tax=Duncaniella sp. TaxID=2518496 RepID=UPI0023D079BC|nr:hypothetical protein [Duncaniella sp.]MDE5988126.1 hypothetical protein [Duncaniella sp.]MDE6174676.1 hypothetical protein [Duncaniella sp.]
MSPTKQRPPLWMTLLIILFLLPAFSFPVLAANIPAGNEAVKTFVWLYPFYMLLSGWLAWSAYPGRSYISWILLLLMALSTAAVWTLVLNPAAAAL